MSTNEQAARAHAEKRWTRPLGWDDGARHAFVEGAKWENRRLLARLPDPDDALAEAVAMAIAEAREEDPCDYFVHQLDDRFTEAHAALAAVAARIAGDEQA